MLLTRPAVLLRLEGLAIVALGLLLYGRAETTWWLWTLLLAPDLAALGYLAGPRAGAAAYNAVHTYVAPAALGAAGLLLDNHLTLAAAIILAAHIGMDRALRYGLKYPTNARDTHLNRV